jgi:hypothetical protein
VDALGISEGDLDELLGGAGGIFPGNFQGNTFIFAQAGLIGGRNLHRVGFGCGEGPVNAAGEELRQLLRAVMPPLLNAGKGKLGDRQTINRSCVAIPLGRAFVGSELGPDLNWLVRAEVNPAWFIRQHGRQIGAPLAAYPGKPPGP